MQCKAFTFNHTCVIEPAPARHSKNLFSSALAYSRLSPFSFQFSVFSFLVVGLIKKIIIRILLHMQLAYLLVDDFL